MRDASVMLLAEDRAAGAVFFVAQFAALGLGDLAVGLGGGFIGSDLRFALVQRIGFLGCQRAGLHALVDAFLLIHFALVDARGIGALGKCGSDKGGGQNGGDQVLSFHVVLQVKNFEGDEHRVHVPLNAKKPDKTTQVL